MKITVFTPTYDRETTLPRAYESLKAQTYRDFTWLIIDDGSQDGTAGLVKGWIEQGELEIEYHYKENGGKHTAQAVAFERARTRYMIGLDSDDILVKDCLEVFVEAWKQIESEPPAEPVAEIRAFAAYTNGEWMGYGDFRMPEGVKYMDSTWHEMVLVHKNHKEMISCWDVQKFRECVDFSDYSWHAEKVNLLFEGIFWARLNRTYATRYLNYVGRIVYTDSPNRLSDSISDDERTRFYSETVSYTYFLDENYRWFYRGFSYFFPILLKLVMARKMLGIPPGEPLKVIRHTGLKAWYIAGQIPGLVLLIYYRRIRKRFW